MTVVRRAVLRFLFFVSLCSIFAGLAAWSVLAEDSLEQKMEELSLPENELPKSVSKEKIYSVQTRYSPLDRRHELSLGGSRMVTSETFLVSHQLTGTYRFHFSNRWSLGSSVSYVFNQPSAAAERLIQVEKIYPQVAFAKTYSDLMASFNAFYGKLRFSMESVMYFDQYLSLGPGVALMNYGWEPALVGDIGLAVWLGRSFSLRLGLKDYFHSEKLRTRVYLTHDLLFHLDAGILIGSQT